jgi:glutathionylspermidine synthase
MELLKLPERPNWRDRARDLGFNFADMYGEPYWDEGHVWRFTMDQIEGCIEDPCTELHALCREAVGRIIASEALMVRMGIPQAQWDFIADSWARAEPELYGRFDLAFDGTGPAKLLEYNADTPTSLYESSAFQWLWLEDQIKAGVLPEAADQFNGIHEALVERFAAICAPGQDLHFAAMKDSPEDYGTVETLGWAAREAGLGAHYTDLQSIGLTADGQFADSEDRVIGALFKLYPWEDLFADDFAQHLASSGCRFIEPPWKALLSNKAILPMLWQMFPDHPNLLPAYFVGEEGAGLEQGHVEKPIFSREGAGIRIVQGGAVIEASDVADYDAHPRIRQAYHPLPQFEGWRPVLGAWMVGEACVGLGVRSDRSRITQNLSRFQPHVILD